MSDATFHSPVLSPLLAALAPEPAEPVPSADDDVVEAYSFNTGLMVLMMILYASLGHKIAARTKYVGEGSAACMLGLFTGLVVLTMQRYLTESSLHQLLTFNPADFFTYLLPPIIFYAGISVKKKQFFRNFASIATFGVLGTYIAFAVIACVLYGFSKLPNVLNFSDCLALGVIFAATDSVAVLQVLKQDRSPLLYSLVFGEGVINDATAVALLRAVQALGKDIKLQSTTVLTIFARFLYVFGASLVVGLTFGLGTAVLLKMLKSNSAPQEVALIGMLAYLSYLCGDWLGLSGIVALFCCAVTISHYALHNVSSLSRVTTVSAFQTLSYVSEGAIFIYVGMDTLDPLKWQNTYLGEALWLFFVLLVLLMVGRAAFVFPISFLHNLWSREKLAKREMVVIWWAGLQRGAIAVALVYYYFDPFGMAEDSHRSTIIATTLILVLFSTVVFSAATKPLLEFMLGPDLADDGTIRRRVSGRTRSGKLQHNPGQYTAAPLYTVVTMDPNDEVANHMLGTRISKRSAHGDITVIMDDEHDSGEDSPNDHGSGSDAFETDTSRHRLLDGNQASDSSELMAAELEAVKAGRAAPFRGGSSLRQSVQADGTVRLGPAGFSSRQADKQQSVEMSDMPLNPESRTTSSLGLGVTPSSSHQDLIQMQQRHQHNDSPQQNGRAGSRLMPPSSSFDDFGEERRQSPGHAENGNVSPSPFAATSQVSPFMTTVQQHRAIPDPAAPSGSAADEENLLDRAHSMHSGRITRWWGRFDAQYMQPVFGGPSPAAAVDAPPTSQPIIDPNAPAAAQLPP